MNLAINGMGRIGRLLLRRLLHHTDYRIVAVNDIMDPENLAYLLKYDSVYGPLFEPMERAGADLVIGGRSIRLLQEPEPSALPWQELNVDVVLECSGRFTTKAGASKHLEAGARKVILSTTGAEELPLMIYGFNQHQLAPELDIISPGGCMTNCCTHLLHLLQSIGIESVQIHVIHSYTSRQELVDGPHKDFRRGRAAAESIIPVPVDLAQSLERLFPMLEGKIATLTSRVPVSNGAMADLNFQMRSDVTVRQVNDLLREAAAGEYAGILTYTEDPIVSMDIKADPHSAIIDGSLTSVVGRQLKVVAFFDNEYGYTSRVIDWIGAVGT